MNEPTCGDQKKKVVVVVVPVMRVKRMICRHLTMADIDIEWW